MAAPAIRLVSLFALIASVVALGAGGAQAASPGKPLAEVDWEKRLRSAERFAESRAGSVSFSFRGGGVHRGRNGDRTYYSASVVKVMLMAAFLRRARDRGLSDDEKEMVRVMIRRSDNEAASRIRDIVGNGSLEDLADRVGMRHFATSSSSWGLTQICSRDMALLMKGIDELLPERHRVFGMTQLRRIVPRQRWGIPDATGWRPYFKGGWTPASEGGWRINQVALLRGPDREELAVAILSNGQPSKGYGTDTIRGVAKRLIGPVTR
jgi:hypothetical protein